MAKLDSLEKVFESELKDIYDAEKRLTKALPKMIKGAHSQELAEVLRGHLDVTNQQIARLEEVFEATGIRAVGKPCAGMKGLVEEGQEVLEAGGSAPYTDLAIIGAARRVEHYEMAAYLGLLEIGEALYGSKVSGLLRENLTEEQDADETLSRIGQNLLTAQPEEDGEMAVMGSNGTKKRSKG